MDISEYSLSGSSISELTELGRWRTLFDSSLMMPGNPRLTRSIIGGSEQIQQYWGRRKYSSRRFRRLRSLTGNYTVKIHRLIPGRYREVRCRYQIDSGMTRSSRHRVVEVWSQGSKNLCKRSLALPTSFLLHLNFL
jgi:hypothetical protein